MSDTPCLLASACHGVRVWQTDIPATPHSGPYPSRIVAMALPENGAQVQDLTWSADGKYLAAVTKSFMYLLDKNGRTIEAVPGGPNEDLQAVAAGIASARYVFYGGAGKTVKIWDVKDRKAVGFLKGHTAAITALACSDDDHRCASGSALGKLLVHSLKHGAVTALVAPFKQAVNKVAFSALRKSILCGVSDEGCVALWDVDSSKRDPVRLFKDAHMAPVKGISFAPTDKHLFCTVGLDKALHCYDAATNSVVQTFDAQVPLMSCSMNGDYMIAMGTSQASTLLYDMRSKAVVATLHSATDNGPVTAVAFQTAKSVSNIAGSDVPVARGGTLKSSVDVQAKPVITGSRSISGPMRVEKSRVNAVQGSEFMGMFSPIKGGAKTDAPDRPISKTSLHKSTSRSTEELSAKTTSISAVSNESHLSRIRNEVERKTSKPTFENVSTAVQRRASQTLNPPTIQPMEQAVSQHSQMASLHDPVNSMFSPLATRVRHASPVATVSPPEDGPGTNDGDQEPTNSSAKPASFWERITAAGSKPQATIGKETTAERSHSHVTDMGAVIDDHSTKPSLKVNKWVEENGSASLNGRQRVPSAVTKRVSAPALSTISHREAVTSSRRASPASQAVAEVPANSAQTKTTTSSTSDVVKHVDMTGLSDRIVGEVRKWASIPDDSAGRSSIGGTKSSGPGGMVGDTLTDSASDLVSAADGGMHHGRQPSTFQYQVLQNVVNDCLEEFRSQLRADVQNMHLDILRQFWIQKSEIEDLVRQYSPNQALMAELQQLREENARLRCNY
ncbi:uncharacterized protein SPPG_02835 [Spizellomyces punctatus DAOM BR117]|uniref:E3 ubiquitin-protein ligase RFWD3-like WD40 domain-containing protein n=1 Tax=Spizellomyces punctatus (strain DAOM BR117) TaxID=645134 RepID=A0A0L0HN57_SPIPD|nr:uncharacterized protein SPPG_02835 [Spizellomyces punctatus DAOM BR117]KND02365.1 hypothetical protein SPPG_02835 [Spizellomyces punctatus DAOM BR117]|eukprot:XP_016610404.1 hypothetical protein SPPG_02835 [Spizellomyces punctatus DAOM BR117]